MIPLRSALGKRVRAILDDSKRGSLRLSRRARVIAGLIMCGGVGVSLLVGAAEVKENQSLVEKVPLKANALGNDSPENTVRAFLKAFDVKDAKTMSQLVDGAMSVEDLQGVVDTLFSSAKVSNLHTTADNFSVQSDGTTASITFRTTMEFEAKGKTQRESANSTVQSRRFANVWKILPPDKVDMSRKAQQGLSGLLQFVAPPEIKLIKAWAKNRGTASVEGRIVNEKGQPLPDVPVSVRMKMQSLKRFPEGITSFELEQKLPFLPQSVSSFFQNTVQTDSSGNYGFAGLTNAQYEVFVPPYERPALLQAQGKIPQRVPTSRQQVFAEEGQNVKVATIEMVPGALIEVRVMDKVTGEPLSGVAITRRSRGQGRGSPRVETDMQGISNFRLAPGKQYIGISGAMMRKNGRYVVELGSTLYELSNVAVVINGKRAEYKGGVGFQVSNGQPNIVTFRLQPYVPPSGVKR